MRKLCVTIFIIVSSFSCLAEQAETLNQKALAGVAKATYLGNEAILVEHANRKVLFDPFFNEGFNIYQMVPDEIRSALFEGKAPYDNIDAVFISHAHADHFSATDLMKFMLAFPGTKVIAPSQAANQIKELSKLTSLNSSLLPIELAYQDPPVRMSLEGIDFDAVRIPHAGWPQRANISNLVFRVSLNKEVTVVHMGDADPDDAHFAPLMEHWESKKTDVAFPPYWFLGSKSGKIVLSQRLKAQRDIGIHVPIIVPRSLIESSALYLSQPGEVVTISQNNK
jgi:L-ascorbate metabolism protein UlaG (beta-lactamase superfamily)